MVYEDKISLLTKGFCDIIDITAKVEEILNKSKIKEGIITIFVVGSTAALTTIEYEPNLLKDFQELMEGLASQNKKYHHDNAWQDNNGFSHLRASLIGPSISIPVSNGKLPLGRWQQIILCEFDNRARDRNIVVKIIGK